MRAVIQRMVWAATIILVISSITGCGSQPVKPIQSVSNLDNPPPQSPLRSWWRRVSDQRGGIEGRVTLADGRPVVRASIIPRPVGAVGGGEINLIGILTNDHGAFRFGSPAGTWDILVIGHDGGVLVSQQVEIKARQTITLELVVTLRCGLKEGPFGPYTACEKPTQ